MHHPIIFHFRLALRKVLHKRKLTIDPRPIFPKSNSTPTIPVIMRLPVYSYFFPEIYWWPRFRNQIPIGCDGRSPADELVKRNQIGLNLLPYLY